MNWRKDGWNVIVEFLQERREEIEQLREKLHELEDGLDGADVEHEGRAAIIMHVDWDAQYVMLNYADEDMRWLPFKKGETNDNE